MTMSEPRRTSGLAVFLAAIVATGCYESVPGEGGGGPTPDSGPSPDRGPPDPGPPPGSPRALARSVPGIQEMELDAEYLYWAGQGAYSGTGEATIWRMPRDGSGPPELLADVPARAYSMAIDDTFIYVPVTGSGDRVGSTEGAILRMPKAGGSVEVLATGIFNPTSIAVDDAYVYYSVAVSPEGEVWRVAKAGGDPSRIAADIDNPWDLAVDEDWLYVSEMNRGQVLRLDKEHGDRTVLASGWVGTDWMNVAGGQVYFGGCSSGPCEPEHFYRTSSDGGPAELLMVSTRERGTK